MLNQHMTEKVEPVTVPDEVCAGAYAEAMLAAEKKAAKFPAFSEAFVDAATEAVLWARDHCRDSGTFPQFCGAVVRRWLFRAVSRETAKAKRRIETVSLSEAVATARRQKPVRPLLIEDLPEDLAFAVRLYMVDGYSLREIGLLIGRSPNTVDLMLKRAAELLAPGRIAPDRRKGERRLSAG